MNKYLAEVKGDSKVLRGPVKIEMPPVHEYLERMEYANHIASLPTIPAEWLTEADNGRLLTLDVDFNTCYDEETDKLELIALPIDKQEGKPERISWDKIEYEISDILYASNGTSAGAKDVISYLKKYFNL